MSYSANDRPALPRDLYRPSHRWAIAYLLYSLCLFAVPSYLSYMALRAQWPWIFKFVAISALVVPAAYGINMMGFVGHEGTHGSLFRHRRASALIGIFWASVIVTYMEAGFALSHWNHHRFTNQKDDPDLWAVRHLKSWWQRLLFSRFIYNTLYLKQTWNMALNRPSPFKYKMGYSRQDQTLFARLNFFFAALWLLFYAWIFFLNPSAGLVGILLPMIGVNFVGASQTYIDHAGLDDRFFANAWSRTSPLMTVLYFGANYHLEHHAYPGIPCYRLPRVHKILTENGTYGRVKPAVVGSFLGSFKALNQPYEAGDFGQDFDPFTRALPGPPCGPGLTAGIQPVKSQEV